MTSAAAQHDNGSSQQQRQNERERMRRRCHQLTFTRTISLTRHWHSLTAPYRTSTPHSPDTTTKRGRSPSIAVLPYQRCNASRETIAALLPSRAHAPLTHTLTHSLRTHRSLNNALTDMPLQLSQPSHHTTHSATMS